MQSIGSKLREMRQAKGFTLQQVADGAGCTAAYVSQIENDKTSPSIASLKKIAEVVDARIVDFFLDDTHEDQVVMDPDQWLSVSLPGWKADIKQMVRTVKHRRMQPFFSIYQPGGGSQEEYAHDGEEFGIVLEGELTLQVGGDTHKVKAGSSFYYSSSASHAFTNDGDVPCTVVWVVTPPSW